MTGHRMEDALVDDIRVPLPREIAPGVHWLGGCTELSHDDEVVHSYSSAFLVTGRKASLLVDTGHPHNWPEVQSQLEGLLSGGLPAPTYLFPTHAEVPHAANLGRLLAMFPDAIVCGDVRDYHLFFPEYEDRLRPSEFGDAIDLGGTEFLLIRPAIKDLVTTMWGYDTASRVLFAGDGFAYMHHRVGECGRIAEELPDLPLPEFTALFAKYALYWTRFTDIEPHIRELDSLLASYDCPIDVIAPAHGSPIMDLETTVPKVKEGLRLGRRAGLAPTTR